MFWIKFGWSIAAASIPITLVVLFLLFPEVEDKVAFGVVVFAIVFVTGVLVAQVGYFLKYREKQCIKNNETKSA